MMRRFGQRTTVRILLFLGVFILFAGDFLLAQEDSESVYTNGELNGRFWEKADNFQRMIYLRGFDDGVYSGAVMMVFKTGDTTNIRRKVGKWIAREYEASGFTKRDYLQELNKLYEDRENILIPIPFALEYSVTKLRGDLTKRELEQRLIILRQQFAVKE